MHLRYSIAQHNALDHNPTHRLLPPAPVTSPPTYTHDRIYSMTLFTAAMRVQWTTPRRASPLTAK